MPGTIEVVARESRYAVRAYFAPVTWLAGLLVRAARRVFGRRAYPRLPLPPAQTPPSPSRTP